MKRLFGLLAIIACTLIFAQQEFTIVLDAGHGGKDTGATYKNLNEKDIAFSIAKQIVKLNENEDVQLILLRDEDEFVDLEKRVAYINELQPDLVLSLHLATTGKYETKSGTEIYTSKISTHAEKSLKYAEQLKHYLKGDVTLLQNNFMILAKTNVPAMLIELGYISNQGDREYLQSEKGQYEIAKNFNRYFDALVK